MMERIHLICVLAALLTVISLTESFETESIDLFGCPDGLVDARCGSDEAQLVLNSITVYSSTDPTDVNQTECVMNSAVHQCKTRLTKSRDDETLSADYWFLFLFTESKCNGKRECDALTLSDDQDLVGTAELVADNVNPDSDVTCPFGETVYATGLLYSFSCRVAEHIPTVGLKDVTSGKSEMVTDGGMEENDNSTTVATLEPEITTDMQENDNFTTVTTLEPEITTEMQEIDNSTTVTTLEPEITTGDTEKDNSTEIIVPPGPKGPPGYQPDEGADNSSIRLHSTGLVTALVLVVMAAANSL